MMLRIQLDTREVTPRTELSLNFPSAYLFKLLLNYFETKRFSDIEFSNIETTPPSHIEGKWFVPQPFVQRLSGNFKIDITENNNESKVKLNINAMNIDLLAFGLFFIGLVLLLIAPPVPMWLMSFGFAIAFFVVGQWRVSNILREVNELLSNISEATEELEKVHEEMIEEERKSVEIVETPEGFDVNLPEKDVFNKLVNYFGADALKQKVPFSHIAGRWTCGSFKIDIIPSNGESQVKINFSCFYINLLACLSFVLSITVLLIRGYSGVGTGGLLSTSILLILGLRMKRNTTRRLKEALK